TMTPSPGASGSAAPTPSATATATATATEGETELVMADGNRTFVLQIPIAKLNPSQAANALTQLAQDVYQDTLPAVASASPRSSSTR
ncbi:hypothetical protein KDL01_31880, partial [Actinospica durhamensis]